MPEATTTDKAIRSGEFHGALAKFCQASYNDLVAAGIDRHTAHVVGCDFGADLGNLMKADAEFAAKVGKANKDGEARIKISGRTASGRMTNAMSLVRIAQTLDGLQKEGLYSRKLDDTRILSESVSDYLTGAKERAAEMVWAS